MAKSTGDTAKIRKKRPAQPGTPVMVRLQPDLLSQLDAFSEAHPDKPSRPEAVRLILKERLGAVNPIGI